jgi:hypothetical protein
MSQSDIDLYEARVRGRWSFAVSPLPNSVFQGSSLLYVSLSEQAHARSWTVNLCAHRYQSGVLAAGTPPDQQVDEQAAYRAVVTWGVDGALEVVSLDYPFSGCTFTVQAATLRVDIVSNNVVNGVIPPGLSGFLAPVPAVQTTVTAPQFTTGLLVLAGGATVVFNVPPRAAAYRIMQGTVQSNVGGLTLLQTTNQGGGPTVSGDGLWPATADYTSQQNRCGYIPLHPQAQQVKVSANVANPNVTVGLQFLMDMG